MDYKKILFLLLSSFLFSGQLVFSQVKPIANGNEKFLGCAWSSNQNVNFTTYWNQVTPENGGKWGSVESTQNTMRWTDMDAAYNLAKKNNMLFKQHTLIWGAQQPSWIGKLDTASQRKEIEQWYSLLAARYPNMEYIDVVNEPLHNAPNGMLPWGSSTPNVDYAKALGGAGKTGYDWVKTAFRMARKYFPNSKLILNEYNVINSSSTTSQYINLIKILQADSLIDGIGEQAHAFTTSGVASTTLKANLDALAKTGLPIYLTEMDIDGKDDLVQLKEMQRVFPIFWEHPAVKGITMWGFRIGMWRSDQGANLISNTNQERPALTWLRAYVDGSLTLTDSIAISIKDDSTRVVKLGNTVNMLAQVLPANTTIPNFTWSTYPAYRATIDSNGKLTAMAPGNVTVSATAIDGSGIKSSLTLKIVEPPTSISDPLFAQFIKVFPNPSVNGNFTIEGIDGITQLNVFDLTGRKIREFRNLGQSSLELDLQVPSGVYLIVLSDGKDFIRKKISVK